MANGDSSAYLLSLLRSQGGYADTAARSLLGRDYATEKQLLEEKNRIIEEEIRKKEREAKKKRKKRGLMSSLSSIAGYALGGPAGAALGNLVGARLSRANQGRIGEIKTDIGTGKFLKGDREDLFNFLKDTNYQLRQHDRKGLGWKEDLLSSAMAYGTGEAFAGTDFGQKMGTFRGWDLGSKIQQSKMMTSGIGGKLKNWWSPNVASADSGAYSNFGLKGNPYSNIKLGRDWRSGLSPVNQVRAGNILNEGLLPFGQNRTMQNRTIDDYLKDLFNSGFSDTSSSSRFPLGLISRGFFN